MISPMRFACAATALIAAAIVGVVDRWQDDAEHDGGVVGHYRSHTTAAFTGGFDRPGSGYEDDGSLTVDRHTGVGMLDRQPDA